MRLGRLNAVGVGKGRVHDSHFSVVTATRASTIAMLLAIPAILLLFSLPAFASRTLLQELFYVFTMLALAQLWNLLAGCAGLISVGQQAFVGVGAYALFACTLMAGLEPVMSIVLAGIVAGLIAVPAALMVFRLRGAYFAIGTWVVAEVCRLVLAQFKQLGGALELAAAGHGRFDCRAGLCPSTVSDPRSRGARHPGLLAGSRACGRHAGPSLQAIAVAVRARPICYR